METNEKLPPYVFWIMLILALSISLNIYQYTAKSPNEAKAVELDNAAKVKRSEASEAQANEKAVDNKTSASFDKQAKMASKRLIEADKPRPIIVKPELDSMSRDLLTFKPRRNE